MNNLILIGMPGSGKSTAGVLAAKGLLKNFFDTDLLIQNLHRERLQSIIDTKGTDAFLAMEEDAVLSLTISGAVIATGGSVVYSPKAMAHLRAMGAVIYLHLDYDTMMKRIHNVSTRGVVLRSGSTFREMYEERLPLYRQYADITIDCSNRTVEETVIDIMDSAARYVSGGHS